jgi:hypothetical protein
MNARPAVPVAVTNRVSNGLRANQRALTANANIGAGNGVSRNLARTNQAATSAANNYSSAANKLNSMASNASGNRKNHLNRAKNHFASAAIDSAANQPLKAVNHARMGINALRAYAGSP